VDVPIINEYNAGFEMRQLPIQVALLMLLTLALAGQLLVAQEKPKDLAAETAANVPELAEFHKVIYKIWHTAWPNKDFDMLTDLLPEIEGGAAAVAKAEIPGILREKKAAWRNGVERLETIVKEYKAAVDGKQKQPLLDAAEKLHAQYEALVRAIRPPLNELEDFHAVLYKIYHYSMPQNSLEEVKASVGQLQGKMAALNKATLPVRFKGKEESFTEARSQLDKAVAQLATTIGSNHSGKIKIAVEAVHDSYQALAKILE
jgi:NADH dehydrogenase/NADH:ubiquinone oxidoreductase subunit G